MKAIMSYGVLLNDGFNTVTGVEGFDRSYGKSVVFDAIDIKELDESDELIDMYDGDLCNTTSVLINGLYWMYTNLSDNNGNEPDMELLHLNTS